MTDRNESTAPGTAQLARSILESTGDCIKLLDLDGRLQFITPTGCALLEIEDAAAVAGADWLGFWKGDDRGAATAALEQARKGGTGRFRGCCPTLRGTSKWWDVLVTPVCDAQHRPERLLAISRDVTDQMRVETALREEARALEAINRAGVVLAAELDLEKVVQTVTDAGVAATGAAFGAFFYNVRDEAGESYTLYTLSGVPREAFARFPMPRNTDVFGPTFRGEGIVRSADITKDSRYGLNAPHKGMPEGHLPVRSYLAVPVVSRSGEVLGGLFFGHPEAGVFTERGERVVAGIAAQAAIAIDNARLYRAAQREIDERRTVEERLRLLLHELDHRVKNTLATVQSIATQTLRTAPPAAFRDAFLDRLRALSGTHDLLTQGNWQGAALRDVLEAELSPYRGAAMRCGLDGPDIRLDPKAAMTLALVFHELATNAAKYGALSAPAGRVEVSWRVADGRVGIEWRESGGPPVTAPSRIGFGSRLIRMSVAHDLGGDADLDFAAEGVRCRIALPRPAKASKRSEPSRLG